MSRVVWLFGIIQATNRLVQSSNRESERFNSYLWLASNALVARVIIIHQSEAFLSIVFRLCSAHSLDNHAQMTNANEEI